MGESCHKNLFLPRLTAGIPESFFSFDATRPTCVGPQPFQQTCINHAAFSLLPSLSDQSGDGRGSRGSCTLECSPGFLDTRRRT